MKVLSSTSLLAVSWAFALGLPVRGAVEWRNLEALGLNHRTLDRCEPEGDCFTPFDFPAMVTRTAAAGMGLSGASGGAVASGAADMGDEGMFRPLPGSSVQVAGGEERIASADHGRGTARLVASASAESLVSGAWGSRGVNATGEGMPAGIGIGGFTLRPSAGGGSDLIQGAVNSAISMDGAGVMTASVFVVMAGVAAGALKRRG